MGKMGLAGASLTSAIPAGALFYVLFTAVSTNLATMPTTLKGAAIMMMVVSLVMAVFPLYILTWYRGRRVVLAKDKKGAGLAAGAAAGAGAAGVAGEDFGGLSDSFAEGLNPQSEHELNEGFDTEMFMGDSEDQQFAGTAEFEASEYEESEEAEIDFETHDSGMATAEFSADDFMEEEFSGTMEIDEPEETLCGEAIEEDFNFELFDDEDEKKK